MQAAFRSAGAFSRPTSNVAAFGGTQPDQAMKLAQDQYLAGLESAAPISWLSGHLTEEQRNDGAVFVAIKVLMAQAANAECKPFRWEDDARQGGDKDKKKYLPRTHEISRLLNRPNRWDSGRDMRKKYVQQKCLTGTWLGWRVDNGFDRPKAIWNVRTGTYSPVSMSPQWPEGAYRIMPFFPGPFGMIPGALQAGGVIVGADHMLVSRDPHALTDKEGQSTLDAMSRPLDTLEAIDLARQSVMMRAPVPSGTLELDSNVKQPDAAQMLRLQIELKQMIGNAKRAGMPAVLGPGQKWVPSEMKGIELPWVESWKQLVAFVMSAFGITKELGFTSEASSYAALYASLKQFNLFTLVPLLEDLMDCLNMQLIWPFWGEEYGVEYAPRQVADEELLERQLETDFKYGLRMFDEMRTLRGLEPVGGEEGKKFVGGPQAMQKPGAGEPPGGPQTNGAAKPATPDGYGQRFEGAPRPQHPDVQRSMPRNTGGAGSLPPKTLAGRNGHTNGTLKR